jgi:hypothetical protein
MMLRPKYLKWRQESIERITKVKSGLISIGEDYLAISLTQIKEISSEISDQSDSSFLSKLNQIDSAEGTLQQLSNIFSITNRSLIKLGHDVEIFISFSYLKKNLPKINIVPDDVTDVTQKSPLELVENANEQCAPIGIDQIGARIDLIIVFLTQKIEPFINLILSASYKDNKFEFSPARGTRLCYADGIPSNQQTEKLNIVNESLNKYFPIQVENSNLLNVFNNKDLKQIIGSPQFFGTEIDKGLRLFGRSSSVRPKNSNLLPISFIDFDYALKINSNLLRKGIENKAKEQLLSSPLPNDITSNLESVTSVIEPLKTAILLTIKIQLKMDAQFSIDWLPPFPATFTVHFTGDTTIYTLVSFSTFSSIGRTGIKYVIKREGDIEFSLKAEVSRSGIDVPDILLEGTSKKLKKIISEKFDELNIIDKIDILEANPIRVSLSQDHFVIYLSENK